MISVSALNIDQQDRDCYCVCYGLARERAARLLSRYFTYYCIACVMLAQNEAMLLFPANQSHQTADR